ncbi:MAG: CAP domain-containing protein [Planctomycetaceae bacterium]|nr:CAP domain-containing protein [Planctomycetaceae bacterium]
MIFAPRRAFAAIGAACLSAALSAAAAEPVATVLDTTDYGCVKVLAFSPDGKTLALTGADGKIHLLDSATGKAIRALPSPSRAVNALCFDPAGERLAVASALGLAILDAADGRVLHRSADTIGEIVSLAGSPDGKWWVTLGSDLQARLFNAMDLDKCRPLTSTGSAMRAARFSPDSKQIAAATLTGGLLWNLPDPSPARKLSGAPGEVAAMVFMGEGHRLIGAGEGASLTVWDLESPGAARTPSEHAGRVVSLAASASGAILASAAADGTIVLRGGLKYGVMHKMNLQQPLAAMALSADGRYLACGLSGSRGGLMIWRLDRVALVSGVRPVSVSETPKPVTAPVTDARLQPVTASYLTAMERAVIAEMNLARTDPLFYAQLVKGFRARMRGNIFISAEGHKIRTKEGVAVLDETIAYLEKVTKAPPLAPSQALALAATEHAKDTGPKGMTGHTGTDGSSAKQRISRHGKPQHCSGENISYGPTTAREIVLQLIIDDGVPSRGHRLNIYEKGFKLAGVAIAPHSHYGTMCVIDYAGGMK